MSYGIKNLARLNLRDSYFAIKSTLNTKKKLHLNVLCNSFPKSGTHLLSQILMQLDNIRYWDDIVSVQALTGVMNTKKHISYKLGSAPAGSLIRSHLMHCPEVLSVLEERPYKKFFIFRDLRDVALSHANWVMKEKAIFLNDIYTNYLSSPDERLMASIIGTPLGTPFGSNLSQPSIGEDFLRWKGWLNDSETCCVKFEDLVGSRGGGCDEKRLKTLKRILKHLDVNLNDTEIETKFSLEVLSPESSHTFRKGQKGAIGGWRAHFNEEHKSSFKQVAGNLLVELNYEKDLNW